MPWPASWSRLTQNPGLNGRFPPLRLLAPVGIISLWCPAGSTGRWLNQIAMQPKLRLHGQSIGYPLLAGDSFGFASAGLVIGPSGRVRLPCTVHCRAPFQTYRALQMWILRDTPQLIGLQTGPVEAEC